MRSPIDWIAAAPRRLVRAVATWPGAGAWGESAVVALPVFTAMAILGFGGGLLRFAAPAPGLAQSLAVALVVPALAEEVVFRALVVPDSGESDRVTLSLMLSTAAFVAWHVVEAVVVLPRAAPIFLRWDFLACAAALGLGCGYVRWRSCSIWPAVALHWLAVALWQTFLGGPGLEALR